MLTKQLFNFVVLILLGCSYTSQAQLINNRLNLYLSTSSGSFSGNSDHIKEGNFEFPSFYNNLSKLKGTSFEAIYQLKEHISVGVAVHNGKGSDWRLADQLDYQGSKVKLSTIAPVIQYHSKFQKEGIYNRLGLFTGISPNFGTTTITLVEQLFTIQSPIPKETETVSKSNYFGIRYFAGIRFDLNQQMGVSAQYTLSQNWTKSSLIVDERFVTSQLQFGIYMKLMKSKRYFY